MADFVKVDPNKMDQKKVDSNEKKPYNKPVIEGKPGTPDYISKAKALIDKMPGKTDIQKTSDQMTKKLVEQGYSLEKARKMSWDQIKSKTPATPAK